MIQLHSHTSTHTQKCRRNYQDSRAKMTSDSEKGHKYTTTHTYGKPPLHSGLKLNEIDAFGSKPP